MSRYTHSIILANRFVTVALFLLVAGSAMAQGTPRVDGVWQTNAKSSPVVALKRADYPEGSVAKVQFAPIDASRVQRVLNKQHQSSGPLQIGIARDMATESDSPAVPDLHWMPAADGGSVARMDVTSPDARALRIGIGMDAIANGIELRVVGSADPDRIVGVVTAAQIRAALVGNAEYWTPHTDGETQTLEWYVPPGHATSGLRIHLIGVSHMLAAANTGFQMPEAACTGGTGPNCAAACEVDAVCQDDLGAGYRASVSAVPLMQFMIDGTGYLCTGTLLNDTTSSRTPYVYSAAHCIGDQASASTLNTIWFAQNTNCGGTIVPPLNVTELTNGADLLYADAGSDVTLVRLRDTPPSGAFFAGWDASQLALNTGIDILHHPLGDGTKISQGTAAQYIGSLTVQGDGSTIHDLIGVGFTSGIVEGGSSGSGLLTRAADGHYLLRGALSVKATDLDCTVVGQPYGGANAAAFSRFDVAFPHVEQWLAPNGETFQISPGITGNWYDPSQTGQGFSLEVLPGNVMLLDWYVFAPNGGQAWITSIGPINGNTAVLDASMGQGSGGRFPPNFNAATVHNQPWGTITLRFDDCSHGEASWQPTAAGYTAGSMPIVRLSQPAGLSCP